MKIKVIIIIIIIIIIELKGKIVPETESDLVYYPHQIEKNSFLGKTELASGKTLKSCEIFLKAVFLPNLVGCTNDVWIITVLPQIGECILETHRSCLSCNGSKLTRFVTKISHGKL